jgi:membrane protein DedA with SNARE-associated domain
MQSVAEFLIHRPAAFAAAGFAIAFCESFVLVSFVFPGSTLLFACGIIVAATSLPLEGILACAALGAVFGQACSFWLGRSFRRSPGRVWPFNRNPELVRDARSFLQEFGIGGVFASRFVAPLRAVVPFIAGMFGMPDGRFWLLNVASALIWTPGILLSGALTFMVVKVVAT